MHQRVLVTAGTLAVVGAIMAMASVLAIIIQHIAK
jgi:hypothetical protein